MINIFDVSPLAGSEPTLPSYHGTWKMMPSLASVIREWTLIDPKGSRHISLPFDLVASELPRCLILWAPSRLLVLSRSCGVLLFIGRDMKGSLRMYYLL